MDFIPLSTKHIRKPSPKRYIVGRKRNQTTMASKAPNEKPDNINAAQKLNKRPSYNSRLKDRIKKKAKGQVCNLKRIIEKKR